MKLIIILASFFVLQAGSVRADNLIGRFGVITDIHHSDKVDSRTRRHSAGLAKVHAFAQAMNSESRIDFIVELGDYIDRLDANNGKDPIANLAEVESAFRSFSGPTYHVLGNHEFDQLTRAQLLPNLRNGTDANRIDPARTWYSFDQGGLHCIVLDADYYGYDDPSGSVKPFDMNGPQSWTNAYIPEAQKQWLIADLAASSLPTILFTHQTMHHNDTQNHNIKNASEIRKILETDGDVLAVFSGHNHRGYYTKIDGIHYFVLQGNVGISDRIPWDTISRVTGGYDTVSDNQYSVIEVFDLGDDVYKLRINGFGHQNSYTVVIPESATLSLLVLGEVALLLALVGVMLLRLRHRCRG